MLEKQKPLGSVKDAKSSGAVVEICSAESGNREL